MARPRQFRIDAFADLERQLRYAPAETRRRQMDAAEALLPEIDIDQAYPHEYIVYRLTSFRPETSGTGSVYDGAAVVSDLVNFVQRVSRALPLKSADVPDRTPALVSSLPDRLGVSSKTVQRYRDIGLVCHFLMDEGGALRLVCFEDALRRFLTAHEGRVSRGQSFTRVGDGNEAAMVEEARTLRAANPSLSLHEAARVLASRHGRSHETMRGILRRSDRDSDAPIFTETAGPLSESDVRLIGRAERFGVAPARLARRFNKSASTIQRAILRDRARRLQVFPLEWIELPTFERSDAGEVLLSAPAVRGRLDDVIDAEFALPMIASIRGYAPASSSDEAAMVAGYQFLKRRAATGRSGGSTGSGKVTMAVLDRAETDLRWAGWLKWRLVSSGLPSALQALEQALHQPLEQQAGADIVRWLTVLVETVRDDVEQVNPSQDHVLKRRAGLAMARVMARESLGESEQRASARHTPGKLEIRTALSHLTPWWPLLMLSPERQAVLDVLTDDDRHLVTRRYGLDGAPPATLEELGKLTATTSRHCRRRLRSVWRVHVAQT